MTYQKMQETYRLGLQAAQAEFEGRPEDAAKIAEMVDPLFNALFEGSKNIQLDMLREFGGNLEMIDDEL